MSKVEYIYDEHDYPIFKIEVADPGVYKATSFNATVYEVSKWEPDTKEPYEPELYLSCYIKWDSCSHFYFGEKDEEGNPDGYLHLCGVEHYKRQAELLAYLYKRAFEEMGREPLEGEEWGNDLLATRLKPSEGRSNASKKEQL